MPPPPPGDCLLGLAASQSRDGVLVRIPGKCLSGPVHVAADIILRERQIKPREQWPNRVWHPSHSLVPINRCDAGRQARVGYLVCQGVEIVMTRYPGSSFRYFGGEGGLRSGNGANLSMVDQQRQFFQKDWAFPEQERYGGLEPTQFFAQIGLQFTTTLCLPRKCQCACAWLGQIWEGTARLARSLRRMGWNGTPISCLLLWKPPRAGSRLFWTCISRTAEISRAGCEPEAVGYRPPQYVLLRSGSACANAQTSGAGGA